MLQFDKVPLVFESTGAFGKYTMEWFNIMVARNKALRLPNLRVLGLAHTFTANSFKSIWGQRLSIVQAVHYAESVIQLRGESLPRAYASLGGPVT